MRIAVVGGGGVGGYVAAKLSQIAPVDLITSSLKSLNIVQNGVQKTYHPTILPTPPKGRIYDLIVFATKSPQLQEKASQLVSHADEHTIVLPLLNGIEPYERLKKLFPKSTVLKGAIYIISNRTASDTIELKGKGALVVMENCGQRCKEIARLFEKAGIKVRLYEDIDQAIWQKYLFIAATAALSALHGKTFGQIVRDHMEEFEELLDEIVQIAKKRGISLDKEKAMELLRKSPPQAKTSLQLDIEKGIIGELDNLIGYLAKESKSFARIYEKLR